MVTEVDHHSIKTRIKDIVKADATVYDSTGSDGKFVDCFVGRPYNDAITTHPTPYLFITNDDNMESQKEIGVVQGNILQATEHTVRYLLVMVDQAQDGRQVEKDLDALGKNLLQVLKSKFELRNSAGADPKCNYSLPERITVFNTSQNGKPIQARTIVLKLLITTS
jgi:hypothetical protein|tara:strand:- start:1464 stop:1961 length:498 start_codon:yes stop_codon:yes gene_type:complete